MALVKMVKKVGTQSHHQTRTAYFLLGADPVECDDKEAQRLLKDFPGSFEIVKGGYEKKQGEVKKGDITNK